MLLPHEKPDSLPLGLAKPLHKGLLGKFRMLMRQLCDPPHTGPSASLANWISSKELQSKALNALWTPLRPRPAQSSHPADYEPKDLTIPK